MAMPKILSMLKVYVVFENEELPENVQKSIINTNINKKYN